MDEACLPADTEHEISSLKSGLEECKNRCSTLEKERQDLLSGFEQKRSKFKEVYQAKEKLLNEQNLELESLRMKLTKNEGEIKQMGVEIQNLKVIASVSENTKQEAVDNLVKRHQDEMESLRKAMEESNEESHRDMVRHFERERRQWENSLSSFKYEKEALEMQLDEMRKRIVNHAQLSEEEELEASMKKAHAEAEKLKSVILPLENEISTLKEDLEKTKTELEESRKIAAELHVKAAKNESSQQGESDGQIVESQPASEGVELDRSLKSEKSSRTDLERYSEILQQQKKEIEAERDDLQQQLQQLHKHFDLEKEEHTVLKQTWLAANDQFLESQRLLMRDNNIIEGVLSDDQRRQVKMLKLKAQASEAREAPSKSPMTLLKMRTEEFKEAASDNISQSEDSDTQSFGSYQEFQDAADAHQQKISIKLTIPESKVETIGKPEYVDVTRIVPGPGQKVVSEKEWNDVLRELRELRASTARSREVLSVSTPRQKHADLFDDDAKMTAEIERLSSKIEVIEKEKAGEAERTKSLEESIRYSAEDAQKQVTEITKKLSDFERMLGNLKEKHVKVKAEDINKVVLLTKEKEKYREELIAFKKEQEKLSQLHDRHLQNLSKDSSKPCDNILAYQKALATERAEKDNLETKLRNEIAFMEETLKAEQSTRDQMETSLASELHDARGEIVSLQSLKSADNDLKKALKQNGELKHQIEKGKMSYDALQTKSSEIIKGLRDKHLAEIKAKEDVESALAEAKNRLQSLHSALETSETVQRDFVRLSQSLQVQLEQLRQEREKERSDAETSSIQSSDIPLSNDPNAEDGAGHRSPALSPDMSRKSEPQAAKSSS